jgi:peptide/nickel transport system substrate-binding protein
MTVGEQQAPPSLDPGTLDSGFTDFAMLPYDTLFWLTPEGKIEGRLAKSWKSVGTNNTEVQVTLQSGVKFSDGEALTADAVAKSLSYARDAKGNYSYVLAGFTFTAVNDTTLDIKTATPNPYITRTLTQIYTVGMIISPKGVADPKSLSLDNTSVGSGPYIYQPTKSVTGDHYTFTANPNYWNKSLQHWNTITLKIVANQQAAVNAAKTGQLDVFKGDLTVATQGKSANLQMVANPAIMQGLFLTDRAGKVSAPLANVKVRQAINYAIDRSAVTKALLGDTGVSTFQTSIKGTDGYSTTNENYYSYNISKAKQLLSEAGYPNGFTLKVVTASFVGFDTLGEAIKAQLAKVGITVQLDIKTDFATYIGGVTGGKYPAFVGGYSANPMYQQGLDFWMPGSNFFNPFHSTSSELTTLWNKAAAESDSARPATDAQMQDYLIENAWNAPVFFAPVVYFAQQSIGGLATSANNPFASPLDWYTTK